MELAGRNNRAILPPSILIPNGAILIQMGTVTGERRAERGAHGFQATGMQSLILSALWVIH